MSTPLLTFCIATFNRAPFIGETLDCIIGQLTDEVEIVVLDGGSSDGTEPLLRRYEAKCPSLRYIRQNENLGVDRDFDRAVQQARGRYCWLMTDDDLLKPGAVASVIQALHEKHSLVVVNAEVRNIDMSRVLETSKLALDRDQTYQPDEVNRLFTATGLYLTFIGAVVILRDLWLGRDRERYFGTLFIHVGVIFQESLPGTAFVLCQPLISIRYGNAMWRPREFEIWMFKWPSLVWSLPALSDDARAAVYPAEPWRDPRRLLFFRAKGTYSLEDFRRWIAPRVGASGLKLAAIVIALFPGPLANMAFLAKLRLFGRNQNVAIADMMSSRFHYRNWRSARQQRR